MAFYKPTTPRDYVEIARRMLRRKWILLAVFTVVLGIGSVLVLRMPKMYKSTALILIQPGQMNSNSINVMMNIEQRLKTLRPMITSRTEMESVIEDLNLFPEMRAKVSLDEVVEATRRRVEVEVQGRDLFRVSFVHDNPKMAQLVTERLSHKLIDESTSDDVKATREKVDFLRQRVDELKRQMKDWDAKVQQFNEDNAEVLVLEGGTAGPVAAAREQLRAVDSEIKAAEAAGPRPRVGGPKRPRPVPGQPDPTQDPTIRSVQGQLDAAQEKLDSLRLSNTDTHPDVIAARQKVDLLQGQLERELARFATAHPAPAPVAPESEATHAPVAPSGPAAPDELTRLRAEREQILSSIDRININLRELPRVRVQLGELERERKRVTEALDGEVHKLSDAETNYTVVAANKGDSFKIQDPANLPEQPDSPKRSVGLVAAAIVGLLFAFGVGLLLVSLDQTVYNEYELSRICDLPVLVSISEYDVAALPPPGGGPSRPDD